MSALALALAGCAIPVAPAAVTHASQFEAPYSCHVRGRGLFVLPDPGCTPGATNPGVTQANIQRTICQAGWSASVRPPESVTEPQKRQALAAYGYYHGRRLRSYELDHLIPISLGGGLDSPTNLWPEPDYPGVGQASFILNPKDRLEDKLRALVCSHRLALGTAQRMIARDWVSAYRRLV
jgi:hypothetical protein